MSRGGNRSRELGLNREKGKENMGGNEWERKTDQVESNDFPVPMTPTFDVVFRRNHLDEGLCLPQPN